jgi:hypothetical protein
VELLALVISSPDRGQRWREEREFATRGLLRTPHSLLLMDTIPTKKSEALRGGVVIGRLTVA